jgi:hypothetical protein
LTREPSSAAEAASALAVCSRGDAGEAAATAVDAWESDDNDNTGALPLDGAAWGGCVDAGHCAGSKGGTTGRTWTNSEPAPPGGATELMAVLDSLSGRPATRGGRALALVAQLRGPHQLQQRVLTPPHPKDQGPVARGMMERVIKLHC